MPDAAPSEQSRVVSHLIAGIAAFATYFCMYAFRKPFTAATFEGQEAYGLAMKSLFVIAQIFGYMLSKVIGVKVVSEMPRHRRALGILTLIGIAELALAGFAVLPLPGKVVMLFLNGLPLGMVFGLVLAYLEGRRHTEAMAAALCASFILSSGVVKSVGTWLMVDHGVSEFAMPFLTGLLFVPPLLVAVWVLDRTPDPAREDRLLRSDRGSMNRRQRWDFFRAYAPGLTLLLLIYVGLTIVRTLRDDFAVEIWHDLGVSEAPEVFAQSETVVAIVVTVLNGTAFFIRRNVTALVAVLLMMAAGFVTIGAAVVLQSAGRLSAFPFMVLCGVGLYIPYVAFHTTVFERLIAASRRVGNMGFLMYLADSAGYLGFTAIIVGRTFLSSDTLAATDGEFLPLFRLSVTVTVLFSLAALVLCAVYFRKVFTEGPVTEEASVAPASAESSTTN